MTMYRVHRNDTKFINVRADSDKEARNLAAALPDLWETSVGRVHCTELDPPKNKDPRFAALFPSDEEREALESAEYLAQYNNQPKKEPTMTPHKHADIIKQWADGATAQIKLYDGRWVDLSTKSPRWELGNDYRVKPPVEKIKYKRFLWRTSKRTWVSIYYPPEEGRGGNMCPEDWDTFVRWIDTEWQEVEV